MSETVTKIDLGNFAIEVRHQLREDEFDVGELTNSVFIDHEFGFNISDSDLKRIISNTEFVVYGYHDIRTVHFGEDNQWYEVANVNGMFHITFCLKNSKRQYFYIVSLSKKNTERLIKVLTVID